MQRFETRRRKGNRSGAGNDSVHGEFVSAATVKFSESDRPEDSGMRIACERVRELLDGLLAGKFFEEATADTVRISAPSLGAEGCVLTTRGQFDLFVKSIPDGDFDDLCTAQQPANT